MCQFRTPAPQQTTCTGWLSQIDNGPATTPRGTLGVEESKARQKILSEKAGGQVAWLFRRPL